MKDLHRFLKILNEPVPFISPQDKDACERLLKEFNEAEADEIASVSYAYWILRSKSKESLPVDARRTSALKEIRRHYVGEGRDYGNALTAIHGALDHRRTYRVDVLRSCFYETHDCEGEDAGLAKKYRRYILDDLKKQSMVVRGVDDRGRVIVYKPPRKSPNVDHEAGEAFVLTQIYTAERAMATNEFASEGKEERLTVVFNFRDYSRKNSPSSSVTITMVKVLQRCYPERLDVLIIVDPPFWMRGLYNLAWPFLSTATASKLKLVSGQAAIDEEFRKIVSGNKKLEVMLANGDISSVDSADYTQQSFYSQYESTQ